MNNVDDTRFLHNGCQVHVSDSSICCFFPQPKLVLSTSQYNGGFIVADGVFNHRLTMFVETERTCREAAKPDIWSRSPVPLVLRLTVRPGC